MTLTAKLPIIQQRVYSALPPPHAHAPSTVRELADRAGLTPRQVDDALRGLRQKRMAFRVERGQFNAGLWERMREPEEPR